MTGALADRVAIVTGGSSGIGRATCLALARAGCHVVAVGRDRDRLAETVALIRDDGVDSDVKVVPLAVDVGSEIEVGWMVATALELTGRIDLLICAAGILRGQGSPMRPVAQLPIPVWDEVIRTNLRGTFLCNRAVLPTMIRQQGGEIVNLSSMAAHLGFAFDATYSASKCGVIGLTESLAQEVQPFGVRVQVLVAGAFATSMMHRRWNGPTGGEALATTIPPPSRAADAIVQLVSLPPTMRLVRPVVGPSNYQTDVGWRNGRQPAVNSTQSRPPSQENSMSDVIVPGASTLAGKVVIVTGGTGGLGLAVARAVAKGEGSVVVADLDESRIAACLAELAEVAVPPGAIRGHRVDVRSEEDAASLAQTTLDQFGQIDALVACAGILRKRGTSPKPIASTTLEEWDEVINTNLKGIFLTNRAVLPAMIKRRSGIIVNVSSVSGLEGRAHDGPYCASKFGINGLTKSIADEVRGYGVKAVAVMPDAIDTALWDQNYPIPRPGNSLPPDHVASLIVFLLTQPEDTLLVDPVIKPFGGRRRKPMGKPAEPALGVAPEPS